MASKTIYVDLDDVLCQAARRFLLIVEREFGKRVAYEELTNFDVGQSCGLTPVEADELYRIVHRPEELLAMEPVREAVAALEDWQRQGFEIAIVTCLPPDS
jgi:phosphoglycolate phosphatase-like HAD superfamily hydrolase